MRWVGSIVAGAVVLSAMCEGAEAATALCAAMLAGETMEAAAEVEARRLALQSWTERAGELGIEFTRWQLAWNRRLSCEPAGGGPFRCTARGRPCRISQVPPPAGTRVLKRGDREE